MAEMIERKIRQNAGLIAEDMLDGPGDQSGDQSGDLSGDLSDEATDDVAVTEQPAAEET